MSGLVRVRINGIETNVSPALAELAGLKVLKESAYNPDGTARRTSPVVPESPDAKKASDKKADKPAKDAEEASR